MQRGVSVKVRYYEDGVGWQEQKNAAATNAVLPSKALTVANMHFAGLDVASVDRFIDLLASNSPTVTLVQNVSPAIMSRIKSNPHVRSNYAVMETSRLEQMQEDGMAALLRYGLQCEPAEVPKAEAKQAFRALVQVNIRIPTGPSLSITVLYMDSVSSRRPTFAMALLKAHPNADVAVLLSNVTDGMQQSEDSYRDVQMHRCNAGFVDAMRDGLEKPLTVTSPWTMWIKSAKFGVLSTMPDIVTGQEAHFVATTLTPREGSQLSTITIPMPRSAKTGRTKSPVGTPSPAMSASQPLTDPAILSAEAAKMGVLPPSTGSGGSTGSELIQRLARQQAAQQLWDVSYSFVLKGSDAKLTPVESAYDVSNFIHSASEAVEALNSKALAWPADFCVVHSTVLCSKAVAHNERQAFRRYARDNKTNAVLLGQMTEAAHTYKQLILSNHGAEKPWVRPTNGVVVDDSRFQRSAKESVQREWSEASCTIVYQITPREMKFNITPLVGIAKDNLKKAIHLLNHAKGPTKDTNPLYGYSYDYALLYSVERQAFWLIAASNVPCDIVACRMV